MMIESQKPALAVDGDELVWILSFQDVMTFAMSKEVHLEITEIIIIMAVNLE